MIKKNFKASLYKGTIRNILYLFFYNDMYLRC